MHVVCVDWVAFNKGSPRFCGAKISHNVRACVNYSAHGRSRSRGNMPNRVVIFMLVCFQICLDLNYGVGFVKLWYLLIHNAGVLYSSALNTLLCSCNRARALTFRNV